MEQTKNYNLVKNNKNTKSPGKAKSYKNWPLPPYAVFRLKPATPWTTTEQFKDLQIGRFNEDFHEHRNHLMEDVHILLRSFSNEYKSNEEEQESPEIQLDHTFNFLMKKEKKTDGSESSAETSHTNNDSFSLHHHSSSRLFAKNVSRKVPASKKGVFRSPRVLPDHFLY